MMEKIYRQNSNFITTDTSGWFLNSQKVELQQTVALTNSNGLGEKVDGLLRKGYLLAAVLNILNIITEFDKELLSSLTQSSRLISDNNAKLEKQSNTIKVLKDRLVSIRTEDRLDPTVNALTPDPSRQIDFFKKQSAVQDIRDALRIPGFSLFWSSLFYHASDYERAFSRLERLKNENSSEKEQNQQKITTAMNNMQVAFVELGKFLDIIQGAGESLGHF